MGYLLDTNVISKTRKIRADSVVIAFLSAADAAGLFLSVLTLGELRKGVEAKRRTDPAVADQRALGGRYRDHFRRSLAPSRYSRRKALRRTVGRPKSSCDRYVDCGNGDWPRPHVGYAQYARF